ncbi:hypothetical protein CNECB9_960035 [Cupriavidus necator]|uniref:Uncharacterized protein n=1 Tax=Cupriavidus necator TaxID=106590 RepID=A0A1K0ISN7_CUPNE|nr:hypothetical protein CNECB9_960035 [Cupriavidus necator]
MKGLCMSFHSHPYSYQTGLLAFHSTSP